MSRDKKKSAEGKPLLERLGAVLGLVGGLLGVVGFVQSCDSQGKLRVLEVSRLLDQAVDQLGGEEGTTLIEPRVSSRSRSHLELARRKLEEALILDPSNARAMDVKCLYLALAGEHAKLAGLCQPVSRMRAFALGSAAFDRGDYATAISSFEQALRLEPSDANAHSSLAVVLLRARKYTESLAEANRALELDPRLRAALLTKGAALLKQNRAQESLETYMVVLRDNPNDGSAHAGLAGALIETGKPGEAIGAARRSIELDPSNAVAYTNLGSALGIQGSYGDAIAQLKKAIELDPRNGDAYENMARAYERSGQLVEATDAARRAIELDPTLVQAHVHLGNALARQGKFEEALRAYDDALSRDPSDKVARENATAVRQARARRSQPGLQPGGHTVMRPAEPKA